MKASLHQGLCHREIEHTATLAEIEVLETDVDAYWVAAGSFEGLLEM